MTRQAPDKDCKGRSGSVEGALVRPRFSPGLILEDSDLTAAVDHGRDLSRMLFRSLFGCGIVCGLTVSVETDQELEVKVAPGLALDGCGDPVQLARPVAISLGRRDGVLADPATSEKQPKLRNLWVVLHGGEKYGAPRQLVSDADELDDLTQPTRIRAIAEVSILSKRPECLCACRPAPEHEDTDKEIAHYNAETSRLFPGKDENRPTPADCHERHRSGKDCAPDGGCGAGCDCGCGVLLARLHWFEDQAAWGAIHVGERRFLRPKFEADPMTDNRPPRSAGAPPAPGPSR